MIVKDWQGNDINVAAYHSRYSHNGNLAIVLKTYEGEPWST